MLPSRSRFRTGVTRYSNGLGMPGMGRIELAERSQPEEMTTTVAKRHAEP